MILNLLSFQRSGNSFFTSQLYGIAPVWRHGGRNLQVMACGLTPNLEGFYSQSERRSNDITEVELKDSDRLYLCKAHSVADLFPGSQNIVIVRHGSDALFSWTDYHLRTKKLTIDPETFQRTFYELLNQWDWSSRVTDMLNHPGTVAVVRYENLDAPGTLRRIGFETDLTEKPAPTFDQLHHLDPTHFPTGFCRVRYRFIYPKLHEDFVQRHHFVMKELGYLV